MHNHLIGGGFGRRLEPDMAYSAARIAKQVDGPVKVVWTREEDIRHDLYRPAYHDLLWARLEGGRIVGWKHRVSGSAVMARFLPAVLPEGCGSRRRRFRPGRPLRHSELTRGVQSRRAAGRHHRFLARRRPEQQRVRHREFHRGARAQGGQGLDRLSARASRQDSALQAALDLVREKSGWGTPLPPRCGRGVAVQVSFASFIATVVECEVDEAGEVKLRRVTSAVDTGLAVNPDTVIAQLQGGLIFGLTAALYGEITLEKGRVQQSNFHDYRMLRIDQVPPIDVHVIRSG